MAYCETEQRILDGAILCIEKYGLAQTTTRRIAEEAGVNIAAVNYHFGSKDNLLARAMEETLNNAFDWGHFSIPDAAGLSERLCVIMEHIISGIVNYPQITRAHFYRPFLEGDCDCEPVQRLNVFAGEIVQNLKSTGARQDEESLKLAVLQILSVLVCSALVPGLFFPAGKNSLNDRKLRSEYIRKTVNSLLHA